jgi:large subunit ribosomal protein L3
MGGERVTVQNLEVLEIDVQRNVMIVAGAVPGQPGGLVEIGSAVKLGEQTNVKSK